MIGLNIRDRSSIDLSLRRCRSQLRISARIAFTALSETAGLKLTKNHAYAGWFEDWDDRIAWLLRAHMDSGRPFGVYYHSILALDRTGAIQILQVDGDLPALAESLAAKGF